MTAGLLTIYIVLLLVGGVMGWAKAGSKVSLITSVTFAVALGVCTYIPIKGGLTLALVLLGLLLVVFAVRYAKTRKFMPAGFMGIVTLAVLGLLLLA